MADVDLPTLDVLLSLIFYSYINWKKRKVNGKFKKEAS